MQFVDGGLKLLYVPYEPRLCTPLMAVCIAFPPKPFKTVNKYATICKAGSENAVPRHNRIVPQRKIQIHGCLATTSPLAVPDDSMRSDAIDQHFRRSCIIAFTVLEECYLLALQINTA